MSYYYLASALPEIKLENPLDISFEDFEVMMKENLTQRDWEKVRIIRIFYDIENIRTLFQNKNLNSVTDRSRSTILYEKVILNKYGNASSVALEEMLVTLIGLPEYIVDFLNRYDSISSRLKHFLELFVSYFCTEIARAEGFLKKYLLFEREWRLIFAAFRAKKLGRNLTYELRYEPPDDDLVMQLISQKDAKTYHPPDRYEDLKSIFDAYQDLPLELHKAICEYRLAKVDKLLGVDLFSIDKILAYMIQLMIIEQWQKLDQEKEIDVVDRIIERKAAS